MQTVLITGSAGLVGSEAARYYGAQGWRVVGIDNDMRGYFFGKQASTVHNRDRLKREVEGYIHHDIDIREYGRLEKVFKQHGADILLIIHAAAQPSHDWAAREPLTDFGINANGTLNLLELYRQYCQKAVFIFASTNKVYGDLPNKLPLEEQSTRWDLPVDHDYYFGIDEAMSIDQSKHSLFGASKAAADLLVQEYGRYFGLKTACFRAGCLTGPAHAGAELHGFLSYLMKCCAAGEHYTVYGYKGKQVRDNIHSHDLITAFDAFFRSPKGGAVYNIGGGRENSCSVLEAIALCRKITGRKLDYTVSEQNRAGDHIWYISDLKKFRADYPKWTRKYTLEDTLKEIFEGL